MVRSVGSRGTTKDALPAIELDLSTTSIPLDAQQEFWRRLKEDWLPTYCYDPARRYDPTGFQSDTKKTN